MEAQFDGCEVSHIGRASNEEADNLANIGSLCLPVPPVVFWEEISEHSIKAKRVSEVIAPKTGEKSKPR